MKKILLFTFIMEIINIATWAQSNSPLNFQKNTLKQNVFKSTSKAKKNNYNTIYSTNCDTVSNMLPTDTLTIYTYNSVGSSSGYVTGSSTYTNTSNSLVYKTRAIGEVYNAHSLFQTDTVSIKGAILLFYRDSLTNLGTTGNSVLTLNITNATNSGGLMPGTTIIATQTLSLASVLSTPFTSHVGYAGNTVFNYDGYMISYPVMFAAPINNVTGLFAITLSMPTNNNDTVVIFSNKRSTHSTSCAQMQTGGSLTWYNDSVLLSASLNLGIVPIACANGTSLVAAFNGPTTTCPGTQTTFTDVSVHNPTSWYWSVNPTTGVNINNPTSQNPNIIFLNGGTYTVSLLASNNSGSDSTSSIIMVDSLPNVSFAILPTSASHIWDIVPSISGNSQAYSYQWNWGDGTTTDSLYTTHTYTNAAHYNICLTVYETFSCYSQFCQTDSLYRLAQNSNAIIQANVVNNTTDINKVNSYSAFKIFPNPTNSLLNIEITPSTLNNNIQITDVLGNTLMDMKINASQQINVNNWQNGIYFIRYGSTALRFIKW